MKAKDTKLNEKWMRHVRTCLLSRGSVESCKRPWKDSTCYAGTFWLGFSKSSGMLFSQEVPFRFSLTTEFNSRLLFEPREWFYTSLLWTVSLNIYTFHLCYVVFPTTRKHGSTHYVHYIMLPVLWAIWEPAWSLYLCILNNRVTEIIVKK